MLVRNWMNTRVITVDEDDNIKFALGYFKQKNTWLLPVMKKGQLTGVITESDVGRASASEATTLEVHELNYLLDSIKVKDIMTSDPITIPPDYTVDEAAEILLENGISAAPVVDRDGNLIGIISEADLFRVLVSLTGPSKRGMQFAFLTEDRSGSIKEVADILRKYGGRLASVLSSYEGVEKGERKVYIRTLEIDRSRLDELKEELKEKSRPLYIVDFLYNDREIY